jgi:hypothetical protein
MRFVGIVSDVFLDYANDLHGGYCAGQTDHPVLFPYSEWLIMYCEAISETFNPTTQPRQVAATWSPLCSPSALEQTSKNALPDLLSCESVYVV